MKANKERKRIEEIVSKVIKKYLKEEKDKSFNIDDYWDLASLSDDQIQSLNTDLLVFVRGNPYGDKLQCVGNKIEVFETIEKRTCECNEVKQKLKQNSIFKIGKLKRNKGRIK